MPIKYKQLSIDPMAKAELRRAKAMERKKQRRSISYSEMIRILCANYQK